MSYGSFNKLQLGLNTRDDAKTGGTAFCAVQLFQ